MNKIYKMLNVNSDFQFNELINKLDLDMSDLLLLEDISNSYLDDTEKKKKVLESLSYSSKKYNIMLDQYKKDTKRRLKESENMTLNNIMELNDLITNVYKKCKTSKNACALIYNFITKSSNKNIANAFFNMVKNANISDNNLKFDTELTIDGQNIAEIIYSMKDNILTFMDGIQEEKNNKKIKESVNYNDVNNNIDEIKSMLNTNNKKMLLNVINLLNNKIKNTNNIEEQNIYSELKNIANAKLNELSESVTSKVVSSVVEENTFDSLLDDITKPTIINITVNKETGDCDIVDDECIDNNCKNNCKNNCIDNYVQSLKVNPNSLCSPILKKPNQAEVISAISTLSTHVNDVKSNSVSNNLDCLNNINVLLNKISDYFNNLLSENKSLNIEKMIENKDAEINQDGVLIINEKYDSYFNPTFYHLINLPSGQSFELNAYRRYNNGKVYYTIDLLDDDYNIIVSSNFNEYGALDDEIKDFLINLGCTCWDKIESDIVEKINDNEVLDEETIYDHSWYENESGKFPKRTKNGVIIDETCTAGATCSANVASVSMPIKTKIKKRKKSIDESLFYNMIMNDINCVNTINNKKYEYKNGYLYENNNLVKTKNKNDMIEYIEGTIILPIIEGLLPYQLDILLEEENNNEVSYNDMTPEQRQMKKNTETELDNKLKANTTVDVSVDDMDNNTNVSSIKDNQEVIGVDDSDINDKKYVIKDKLNNKVKVLSATNIKLKDSK